MLVHAHDAQERRPLRAGCQAGSGARDCRSMNWQRRAFDLAPAQDGVSNRAGASQELDEPAGEEHHNDNDQAREEQLLIIGDRAQELRQDAQRSATDKTAPD